MIDKSHKLYNLKITEFITRKCQMFYVSALATEKKTLTSIRALDVYIRDVYIYIYTYIYVNMYVYYNIM